MRIAFITPEFVTDVGNAGGLANYLFRIGKLLVQRGHQVEVFVYSNLEPSILVHEGIRVERVSPLAGAWLRIVRFMARMPRVGYPFHLITRAYALAAAMQRRHRVAPFDIVQSSDYLAVGFAVRTMKGRVHLVRCSSAADLCNELSGDNSTSQKWRERLERATLRRADKAYAPSRFVAAHYRNRHGIAVDVLRPPMGLEVTPSIDPPCGLPDRFLFHFGRLGAKTGTPWLANSLRLALEAEPSLRMVWAGRGKFDEITDLRDSLGQHRFKVQILYPLAKPDVYAVLQRADATVLPSLVDNLPNTAIESLTLGIPVIGTRGVSIDELVEHGITGELVQLGDVDGLASAMVKFWRGETSVRKGFAWRGGIAEEMQPERAVENLLKMAAAAAGSSLNAPLSGNDSMKVNADEVNLMES